MSTHILDSYFWNPTSQFFILFGILNFRNIFVSDK